MGQLSEYEVLSQLGSGKFSVVYRARVKKTGEIVALKKVQVFEMMDSKARQDCIKEVQLLQSLDHPNIVRYLDSFLEENELNIALELADYGDLLKLIRQHEKEGQHIHEGIIWHVFRQVAAGLNHMHERRIMHRDLKPANVFLSEDGRVKLGDLGLGRYFSSKTYEAHSLVGTPYYMSPERMHESGYDFKSDIWSLGCLLYELAALRSPFYAKGLNLYTLCQKIDKCEYPPLPAFYSQELRDLVARMIVTDPKNRPDTAEIYKIASEMAARIPAPQASA